MSLKLNGEPMSVSEVKEGRACLRSWAGEYAWDEWPEQELDLGNEEVGHALHAMSKTYLDTGVLPKDPVWLTIKGRPGTQQKDRTIDVAALFLEGYQHLPRACSGVTSEIQLTAEVNGLPWTWTPDAIRAIGHDPEISDNKTSSDPKRYGLWTLGKWIDDPQAMGYGKFALDAMRRAGYSPQKAHFNWVYYWTKGTGKGDWKPKAEASRTTLTVPEVEGAFSRVVQPIAEKLYTLRSKGKVNPLTLPANAAHCQAYNRPCRFLGVRCNPDKHDVILASLAGFGKKENMTAPQNIFGNLPGINGPAAAPAQLPANGTPSPAFSFGAQVPAAQPMQQPAAPVPQSTQQTGFTFPQQAPQLAAPVQQTQTTAPQFGNFNPAAPAPAPAPVAPQAPQAPEQQTVALLANVLDVIAVGFRMAAEAMRRG